MLLVAFITPLILRVSVLVFTFFSTCIDMLKSILAHIPSAFPNQFFFNRVVYLVW